MGSASSEKLASTIFITINATYFLMIRYALLFFLFSISCLQAQSVDPLRTKDALAQDKWVDSILSGMTVDQKIGQLFMVQAYSNKDVAHTEEILGLIEKYHVGNLIFMQGTPAKQAVLNNTYQAASKIPLLIGFDGEWGLDMRLKNTYRYPWNMTLGAVQDLELITAFGERLGVHCKRMGIHINFAPVVDINTNPKNPIIGNRSFGENKENVTQKAIAFTKGMQGMGVLANAKHFPGHGDTATDSHHTLPVVSFDAQRLDSVELYPYRQLFDAGMTSVMTAHLSVPSLEVNEQLPTSLSPVVVTDLLQQKMGFLGLVITDGLNMKGAANYATSAQINLAAINAGNDLLLIPQEIVPTVALFKESLQTGMLSLERLEQSVRKILRAKYWAGLHEYQPVVLENLHEELNSKADEVLHRKLVESSLTILKNESHLLPIQQLETKKIAVVKLGTTSNTSFVKMLKNYAAVTEVSADNLDELIRKLKTYNLVVVGFHSANDHPWKSYKFSEKEVHWLQEISRTNKVITTVFASPYSLLQVKSFKNIEGLLVAYQNSVQAQELAAQAIFGAVAVHGKLPVSIQDSFLEGTGLVTRKLHRLQYGIPESVGMSSKKLEKIRQLADTILEEKMTPGMQVLVARNGKVVYQQSFGYHTYEKEQKVQNSDVYDLASLTKILSSLPLVMKAVEEKQFGLNTRLDVLLPAFKDSNKDSVTVQEMLSHNARLHAWIPFYKQTQDSVSGKNLEQFYSATKSEKYPVRVATNLFLNKMYKDSMYATIRAVDQREKPGYKYSDLGYYLLKESLESKYKKSLNELVDSFFYKELGANRTSYLPLRKFPLKEIVPTEKDTYFRNQLLHGDVHDMGAAMLGGVGGHAGLFSNANDVAKLMQLFLQKGYYGGKRYLNAKTIEAFNKRYYAANKVRRGLGFDKPQLNEKIKATCGCVSDNSFGHSGFTGTYTWADPDSGLVYVFLSNRVYPTMDNKGLVKENIRTRIQQYIQDAIVDE